MEPKESAAIRRVMAALQRLGVLRLTDADLPSVAGLAAEEPIRGSWWAHPQAHAIARVAGRIAAHADVLTTKLISGKVTFVHRKVWPALLAVATSKEPWQVQGLTPLARSLLSLVGRKSVLRTDDVPVLAGVSVKAVGEAARELERRLLVYGEQFHTERGSHAKRVESWEHLARRRRLTGRKMSVGQAKKKFEEIATALEAQCRTSVSLPWKKL